MFLYRRSWLPQSSGVRYLGVVARLIAATLFVAGSVHAAPDGIAAELARAVDLKTQRLRIAAARKLAGRKDVTLEHWRKAAREFGTFKPEPVGATTVRVPLQVGRTVEDTEITVYVPQKYRPDRPAPVLLALHGTGGNGRNLYLHWRGTADHLGMLVVCPSEAGPNKGYGFTERERVSTLQVLRWARRRYNIDENRVFLGGFRRGGHLAWDLALRGRDRFAALAVMNGAPSMVTRSGANRGVNNTRYLKNVLDLPLRDLQGQKGHRPPLLDTVPILFKRLAEWNASDALLIEGGSNRFTAFDWKAFWGGAVRDPRPKRVIRAYARPGEARAFWAEILSTSGKVKEDVRLVATAEEMRKLDDTGFLLFMDREAEKRTAYLEIERTETGRFVATEKRVRKFRLLLDRTMLDAAGDEITVVFNGKWYKKTPRPSVRVLLEEFVERFDRTFLPIAEVRVP